ncbi:MAG: insulinase family protein, partial [Bdellovibrionota bacterium]
MSTPLLVQKTAKNGLRILCERVPTAPVVALQAWVGVGSADETPREAGLAHVHEHMLFKGTAHRGVGEIAREVEAAGGEINAWTSFDETVYHITMSSRYFKTGLDVLSDAIQHSSFDAEELAREKEVVLEEIRRGDDQPSRRLSQRIFSSSFKKHPYGLPVIGTKKSVSSFGRKHVVDFYKKWYIPNNLTFVVSGDVDPEAAALAVEKIFSKSRAGKIRRPARADEPLSRGPRFFAEVADAGDSYAALAFPAAALLHPDAPALDVLAEILGGGEASRLFERVQAEKGLVSTVYAHAYTPKDPGLFLVGANPFVGKEREALAAVAKELFEIREHGVTDEELSRAKLNLEAESVYLRETVQGRARKWGFSLLLTGDASFEERYLSAIRSLTREDILRVAKEYLRPERIAAGLIQPGTAKGKQKTAEEKKIAGDLEALFRGEGSKSKTAARRPAKEEGRPSLHTLPNGMRVVIEKNTSVPVVALKAVWLGGSRFETAPDAGLYHFLAEMLPRGAAERSATQIRHEAEEIAGSATGVAGRNSTGVDVQCLSRFWERGLSLLADLTLRPNFPEDEIEKTRA